MVSPDSPDSQRARHVPTVATVSPSRPAMAVLALPSAAINTMRARRTRPCRNARELAQALSCSRPAGASLSGFFGRPVIMGTTLQCTGAHDTKSPWIMSTAF